MLIGKSIIKFVELNLLNFSRQSGSIYSTSAISFSSSSRLQVIKVEAKIAKNVIILKQNWTTKRNIRVDLG